MLFQCQSVINMCAILLDLWRLSSRVWNWQKNSVTNQWPASPFLSVMQMMTRRKFCPSVILITWPTLFRCSEGQEENYIYNKTKLVEGAQLLSRLLLILSGIHLYFPWSGKFCSMMSAVLLISFDVSILLPLWILKWRIHPARKQGAWGKHQRPTVKGPNYH